MLFPNAMESAPVARLKIVLSPGKISAGAEVFFFNGRLSSIYFNGALQHADQEKISIRDVDIEDQKWGAMVLKFHDIGMEKLRL